MTQVHTSDKLGSGQRKAQDSAVGECAKNGGETSSAGRFLRLFFVQEEDP